MKPYIDYCGACGRDKEREDRWVCNDCWGESGGSGGIYG